MESSVDWNWRLYLKSRHHLLLSVVLAGGIGLGAVDSFHLIKIQPRQLDSFRIKRDLFVFGRLQTNRSPVTEAQIAALPPPSSTDPIVGPIAGEPVTPRFEVVFLGSIVRKERRCALLAVNGEMQVVEEGETLENGWCVKKVSLTSLTVKTEQGDMLFAVEGDGHE